MSCASAVAPPSDSTRSDRALEVPGPLTSSNQNLATSVLVVDDDWAVREVLCRHLEREGYVVHEASDGAEALACANEAPVTVVLLDLNLPDMAGLDVLAQLRRRQEDMHIIVLTGAGSESERVKGLMSGADDYVVKPFSVRELTARVAAARRRRHALAPRVLQYGDLRIDTAARLARAKGRRLDLTRKEFDLLVHLASNAGRTLSRDDLLRDVWGSSAEWQSPATVTEHVRRMRRKIESASDGAVRIATVRGCGYRFESSDLRSPIGEVESAARTSISAEGATVVLVGDEIVSVSAAALGLVGATDESQVVGRDVIDFVAPSSRDAMAARRQALERGQWPRPEVLGMCRLDGREIAVEVSSALVMWNGRQARQISLWDLADRRSDGSTAEEDRDAPEPAAEMAVTDAELRRGLERGEFVVHYQPVVRLDDSRWVGVEALVRWQHPERGLVAPDRFIGVAERSGTIVDIGRFVLEEACRQWTRWNAEGDLLTVSVNLSARQLADPDLVAGVRRTLEDHAVPADQLWLEVTESELVRDLGEATARLVRLSELGVRLSIDDFGTGWASLAYLREFPIHAIKLDRLFIDGLGRNSADSAIVSSVIRLAHELGLSTIAEGVETASQLATLVQLGCQFGQGFLFSQPVPAADLGPARPFDLSGGDVAPGRARAPRSLHRG